VYYVLKVILVDLGGKRNMEDASVEMLWKTKTNNSNDLLTHYFDKNKL